MTIDHGKDPLHHTSMYARNLDDSEDSDGEGGQGNLNRMVMRPPGHSGKAKKGHLCFDASFESGNLGRVDLVSEFEYDLFIRPDTCCPRLRMWFNFMVDNVRQDQRVIFNVVNFGKCRNLYNTEMTPIVKSTSRPKWQRLMRKHVYYHRSIYHRFRHILSFAFAFDREEDVYHFAMAVPYSYSRLQSYLDVWIRKAKCLNNCVERKAIGNSIQKRKIDLITIGNEEMDDEERKKNELRRVVFIIARSHGGEVPTSFVCQGLMDFMISPHPMAKFLRQNVTLKIIPMLNPDGVHLGNQKTNLLGMDLNRSWHMISQWAHPTLKCAHEAIKDVDAKKERYQLDFVIDIHAHTSLKGCFIYGNAYDDVYRYERHIVFPKVVAAKIEGYCMENSLYNADPLKLGTARRYFCTNLGKNTNSFTLQVSMGGYHLPNFQHYIHHNEESYLRLGRNLGKSLYEYYKQINVIPTIVKNVDGKQKRSKRKLKNARLKVPKMTSRVQPVQQCLETRIISPSIIAPHCSQVEDQEIVQDQLSVFPRLGFRRLGGAGKSTSGAVRPITSSPPRKLAIIDLNNTIRSGLRSSHSRAAFRNRLERRSAKTKLMKRDLNCVITPREIFSSDDDYIDVD